MTRPRHREPTTWSSWSWLERAMLVICPTLAGAAVWFSLTG